ncbi:MAG TPA: cytochrome b/b6 domain-containing protein [Trichocoleus sp.]
MAAHKPYQPLPLRLLHGGIGVFILLALITGFWVYNTYDGRLGQMPLPSLGDIQGIHGTFGLCFLLIFPAFALYSFQAGKHRLIQAGTFSRLANLANPQGWLSWQRVSNTLMLLAATVAAVSGRLMKEAWLPAGELYHKAYSAHLAGWVLMLFSLVLHVLLNLKVGGLPLVASMVDRQIRERDTPQIWLKDLRQWVHNVTGR